MSRWIKWLLLINLAFIAVLVFAYPQLMVSPGTLQPAHSSIGNDCFACHVPLRGASADKCTACHRPNDIGRLTTSGRPIVGGTPFHQALARTDCMACHREHANRLTPVAGTAARFDHSMLRSAQASDCRSCHNAPDTRVHRGVNVQCSQCHTTQAWEPATFDHDRYFPLVGEHRASCATCHPRNDTSRYTCYGCHEHTPANIREEHLEEGIRNFLNCADCHGPRARSNGEGRWRGDDDDD